MDISQNDTAIVFIDPQNEVLSEKGLAWGLVGGSVTENNTVENMERIFKAAKANGFEVFISPHYFFPTDSGWKFNGPLEADEAENKMFRRSGRLSLEGFTRSGADWLERFKPYIEDGKTIVVSPHRVFGPQTNDLVLQLPSAASARSSSVECWRTCALNLTCVICWNRGLKPWLRRTRRRPLDIPSGGTDTPPRSSTSSFWRTRCGRQTRPSRLWSAAHKRSLRIGRVERRRIRNSGSRKRRSRQTPRVDDGPGGSPRRREMVNRPMRLRIVAVNNSMKCRAGGLAKGATLVYQHELPNVPRKSIKRRARRTAWWRPTARWPQAANR